jgi:hypothetical protein
VKEAAGTKDYAEARKQFDTTIDKLEEGIAQARKQLGGRGSSRFLSQLESSRPKSATQILAAVVSDLLRLID